VLRAWIARLLRLRPLPPLGTPAADAEVIPPTTVGVLTMRVSVDRQGVTASVRPVPTDNTMAVLPLTLERVKKDPTDIKAADATKVSSLDDAFSQFQPKVSLKHTVDDTEFVADLKFERLSDFDPESIRTRKPGQRNDIADLQGRVDTLNQLKAKFAQAKVKRAWDEPQHRTQILEALQQFQAQIEKIAGGEE
jgi:hypothetical protein